MTIPFSKCCRPPVGRNAPLARTGSRLLRVVQSPSNTRPVPEELLKALSGLLKLGNHHHTLTATLRRSPAAPGTKVCRSNSSGVQNAWSAASEIGISSGLGSGHRSRKPVAVAPCLASNIQITSGRGCAACPTRHDRRPQSCSTAARTARARVASYHCAAKNCVAAG
jgi:hypothetical protein